ncbi:hypothetical protein [Anatilimnocola floriformis]|uniref:hypothetical protein n=1 Tax=Anatilimnocola floriformis TaxID=2948575 RepID=UPI0020C3CBF0|nr:hypothetical protein [Anatilimnocola floriformis]
MQEIDSLISDFVARRFESHPFPRALAIARSSPANAQLLALRLLRELPEHATLQNAMFTFVPADGWQELVNEAIEIMRTDQAHEPAAAVIEHAALQSLATLHPHLPELFRLAPNRGTHCENWPWREASPADVKHLVAVIKASAEEQSECLRAWEYLLESRSPELLEQALVLSERVELNLKMSEWGLPPSLTTADFMHEVGVEQLTNGFRQLYSRDAWHLVFAEDYFVEKKPVWSSRENHPTWQAPAHGDCETVQIGGPGSSVCRSCQGELHRLVYFPTTNAMPGVTLPQLSIETCLSCLGWEVGRMFYQHDEQGLPSCLASTTCKPKFPSTGLAAAAAKLVQQGERWRWQTWDDAQNLNRVGGHPVWVQSAEYPPCPLCHQTMSFLLQLNSELTTTNRREFMWGSGGLGYVFWCDACRVSGLLWQCT